MRFSSSFLKFIFDFISFFLLGRTIWRNRVRSHRNLETSNYRKYCTCSSPYSHRLICFSSLFFHRSFPTIQSQCFDLASSRFFHPVMITIGKGQIFHSSEFGISNFTSCSFLGFLFLGDFMFSLDCGSGNDSKTLLTYLSVSLKRQKFSSSIFTMLVSTLLYMMCFFVFSKRSGLARKRLKRRYEIPRIEKLWCISTCWRPLVAENQIWSTRYVFHT